MLLLCDRLPPLPTDQRDFKIKFTLYIYFCRCTTVSATTASRSAPVHLLWAADAKQLIRRRSGQFSEITHPYPPSQPLTIHTHSSTNNKATHTHTHIYIFIVVYIYIHHDKLPILIFLCNTTLVLFIFCSPPLFFLCLFFF